MAPDWFRHSHVTGLLQVDGGMNDSQGDVAHILHFHPSSRRLRVVRAEERRYLEGMSEILIRIPTLVVNAIK